MTATKKYRFSIVVPVYHNELNLPETIPALLNLAKEAPGCELDLVLVDDGSGDRSVEVIREHQKKFPGAITLVRLTRNFGSMAAIQAGLTAAAGDCVGMISADLQDPPELFLKMLAQWRDGVKVILATRQTRDESFGKTIFADIYYFLMRRFALSRYPKGGFDFCLVDRQVVEDLKRIAEKNTNVMSLIFWLGYQPVIMPYSRKKRTHGKSRWTFMKRVKLFIDSFVSFSYAPIRLITTVGFITAAAAIVYSAFILYYRLIHAHPVQGFTTLAVLIALSFGMQMMVLGILGEYLWRALDETRKRPPYVIDEIERR
ncbi:MAG: glycosyltransferase family 2 protein [Elusimicrobiota bacterium]